MKKRKFKSVSGFKKGTHPKTHDLCVWPSPTLNLTLHVLNLISIWVDPDD